MGTGDRFLERGDDVRIGRVRLAALAELEVAGVLELRPLLVRCLQPLECLPLEAVEARTADGRGRAAEVLAAEVRSRPDRVEEPGAAIARDVRDPHLGHDLQHALLEGAEEPTLRLVGRGSVAADAVVRRHAARPSRARAAETRRRRRSRAGMRSRACRAARPTRRAASSACAGRRRRAACAPPRARGSPESAHARRLRPGRERQRSSAPAATADSARTTSRSRARPSPSSPVNVASSRSGESASRPDG